MSSPRYALDRGDLKARLARGEATFGTFLGARSAVTAEVCAAAGVDWVLLDLEHGAGGEEQAGDVVPAAASYGVPTVVRAESTERIRAGRLLDLGAAGVMFPRIEGPRTRPARSRHLRYPPLGDRGVATYNRHVPVRARPRRPRPLRRRGARRRPDRDRRARSRRSRRSPPSTVSTCCSSARATSRSPSACPATSALRCTSTRCERVLAAAKAHGKAAGLLVPDGAAAAAMTDVRLAVPGHRLGHHAPRQRGGRRAAPSRGARMTTLARTDVVVALGRGRTRLWSATTCRRTRPSWPSPPPRTCAHATGAIARADAVVDRDLLDRMPLLRVRRAHRGRRRPGRRRRGHPPRHRRRGHPGCRHQRRRRGHAGDDPAPGQAAVGRDCLRRRGAVGTSAAGSRWATSRAPRSASSATAASVAGSPTWPVPSA